MVCASNTQGTNPSINSFKIDSINMLRNLTTLVFTLFITCQTWGQSLSVSPALVNFGVVTELSPDSQQITLSNSGPLDIQVTGFVFYTTYGQTAFSTSSSGFTIPAGGNQSMWITCSPRHNVYHNSELFILNDGHQGAVRVNLNAQGRFSNPYYDHTENLEEEILKDTLNGLLGRNTFNAGYVIARDSMFMSYDNEKVNGAGALVNTIECVYPGRKATGYIDRTDCQTNFSFNTEHTFPQGFFGSLEPMRADLYHLFPTDDQANNVRGSLPFGTVSTPTWTQGGSKCDNVVFEPRDVHKGKTARAMFYFVLRYQNYTGFLTTQEGILRQWHTQFPPNSSEKLRGNRIAQLQLNRNPFIDYPQFIERISNISNTSIGTVAAAFDFPEDTIDYGLIDAGIPNDYAFWITNTGNAPLTCSNLTLNPSSILSFTAGSGGPVTIQPGEAAAVHVRIANAVPGTIGTASLTFNLSGTGVLAVENIPIVARLSLTGVQSAEMRNDFRLFPNPSSGRLCWDKPTDDLEMTLQISDMQGRDMLRLNANDWGCEELSVLPAGIYTIRWNNGRTSGTQMWVKQ
jgi:hypothetical protein